MKVEEPPNEPLFTNRRANSQRNKRERLAWPKDRQFTILSMDGGGIRGVFTAEFAKILEVEFGGGKPLASYLDLIAGTSTGGIVAIGLGMGIPATRIAEFYATEGKSIFPPSRWYYLRHNSLTRGVRKLFRPAFSTRVLEDALRKQLQQMRVGHSKARLLVPSFIYPTSEIAVLKTDHHPVIERDWKTLAWKAARATSAAPTYFEGLQDGERVFADGGLWANNPIMLAVVEAYSCFDISLEQIRVLSIGCGNPPVHFKRKSYLGGMITWRKAFELSSFLTTDNALAQAQILLGPHKVMRVRPEGEAAGVPIDDWKEASAVLPTEARRAFNEARGDLKSFFQTPVEDWARHYSAEYFSPNTEFASN